MSGRAEPALVILDGRLPSVVALWMEIARAALEETGTGARAVPWFPALPLPAPAHRHRAAQRAAELSGLGPLVDAEPAFPQPAARQGLDLSLGGPHMTGILVEAALAAGARRLRRVVWPVHIGATPDTDLDLSILADLGDRALLAGRLASLDVGFPVRIETPLADLTDAQIVELAFDLDAPVEAARICESDAEDPCGRCPACARWDSAIALATGRVRAPSPAAEVRIMPGSRQNGPSRPEERSAPLRGT